MTEHTAGKLAALSPEQAALLPEVAAEWIAHGLSTAPADRGAAEEGVRAAYEAAGLPAPKLMIWLGSPLAGAIGQGLLRDQVSDQVWDQVVGQVRTQVWGQVRTQVVGQVRTQVWGQVRTQVWGQVRTQVEGPVLGQVADQVTDWDAGAIINPGWITGWLASFSVYSRLGIDTSLADGLAAVARNAGWWWPLRGVAVLTERPTQLHRDKDGRLHCEDGPAMLWPDGFAVHAWHGTHVPADLIKTGWDVDRIFGETNAEVRRCAIERMGWDQFIDATGMQRVGDTTPDPGNHSHSIALYELPGRLADMFGEHARILLCTNGSVERDGTRKRYGLVVPGHHDDPIAAAADLYGIPPAAYASLEIRR